MYEYIKGKYMGIIKDYIIIENNNIGYKIFTSGITMSEMPKVSEEVMLYLTQIVREDFIGLYGFISRDELNMFNMLLGINGVGAKAALSLLSISKITNLKYAIMTGDDKHLCKAPGIGKKTAGRIILELKDKLKPDEFLNDEGLEIGSEQETDYENIQEVLGALLALGYSEKEANTAIKTINKGNSVEEMIKEALKVLMG
ncbi:Holliday junction branch migration protein RuvA [Clostridium thermobutyricum]|uniref:Holliday junction branch migration complex subunit RuvA n=1 Tax=Clostridium thermobutyricum TaxID=29372 RepID=N9WGE7_9CLOT|nr:Holliday junction branch migration protein RuvA [Clostridium thermobutyricum]ENZ02146.1 Holliday junction ATP-dependent DNA helicase ruvA [Clostridium thermobutyricum]